MADYKHDKTLLLPHGDHASFEHVRFCECCAVTVSAYARLESGRGMDFEFSEDGKAVRIFGDSRYTPQAVSSLKQIAAELFFNGRSPTFSKLPDDIAALRNNLDSTFAAAAEAVSMTALIDFPLSFRALSNRQQNSLHRLQSFLAEYKISVETLESDRPQVKITCIGEDNLAIGTALMEWASKKIVKKPDLSEGSIADQYRALAANDDVKGAILLALGLTG